MVYPGDEISVSGHATGAEEIAEGCLYEFEVHARKEEYVVASGTVSFVVFE
jgi:hypothetical protein